MHDEKTDFKYSVFKVYIKYVLMYSSFSGPQFFYGSVVGWLVVGAFGWWLVGRNRRQLVGQLIGGQCQVVDWSVDLKKPLIYAAPLDILFRYDLNTSCSFFTSSSFISPDFVLLRSFIPLLKSPNLLLGLFPLK